MSGSDDPGWVPPVAGPTQGGPADTHFHNYVSRLHTSLDRSPPEWDLGQHHHPYGGVRVGQSIRDRAPIASRGPWRWLQGRLRRVDGVAGIRYAVPPEHYAAQSSADQRSRDQNSTRPSLIRAVASGGALYPTEVYAVIRAGDGTSCILHYDATADDCDIISSGRGAERLSRVFLRHTSGNTNVTLVFTTRFEKSAFKYQEFCYRVTALDLGVYLSAALVLDVALADTPDVQLLFPDNVVDAALGLESGVEAAYAAVHYRTAWNMAPLATLAAARHRGARRARCRREPCSRLSRWPDVMHLHEDARWSSAQYGLPRPSMPIWPLRVSSDASVALPTGVTALAHPHIRQSHFPTHCRRMGLEVLARLLTLCTAPVLSDLATPETMLANLQLYVLVRNVEALAQGAYVFKPESNSLMRIEGEDAVSALGNTARDPMAFQGLALASVVLVPVGHLYGGADIYGSRWYRMLQMHVGIVAGRAYGILGEDFTCRPNLGYWVERMDDLLHLPLGWSSLLQVIIGGDQIRPQLTIDLHT